MVLGGPMKYPRVDNIQETREITTYFQGYNHTLACPEGAFFDTHNITTEFFPVLSPRNKRGFKQSFTNLQGILDKEELIWVDDNELYVDNEPTHVTTSDGEKVLAKMGAFVIIMPDRIWYNTKDKTYGRMDALFSATQSVSITLCGADGSAITYHDADYYKSHTPNEGDYLMSTTNGKTSLKVYSSATSMWSTVATTYLKVESTGLGAGFEEGDGVKLSLDLTNESWPYAKNIFVNEDENNKNIRYSYFVIKEKGDNYITIPGLIDANKTFGNIPIVSEREVPDMAFITECQNRLWGCSTDGHEIYCCKLGDVKNWRCYAGISTDSWAATVGTDGKFTGAFSYLGYPIFFKEDSLIRITISAQGAHQTRDIQCRGVQAGSEKSLCMVNELLYYKSGNSVCSYDGQFPQTVSDALGVGNFYNAVGGSLEGRYYISMEDENKIYHLFVYDTKQGLWAREDNTKVKFFVRNHNKLYFVADNELYSVNAEEKDSVESDFDWMVESGAIGYQSADRKNLSRISVRMTLHNLSYASLQIQYDSEGPWLNAWQMYGKGTQTFTIPMLPHRCDHYRIRLKGHGYAKVYSITKSYTEGSDI